MTMAATPVMMVTMAATPEGVLQNPIQSAAVADAHLGTNAGFCQSRLVVNIITTRQCEVRWVRVGSKGAPLA
jgi:hypothetical protein